MHWKVARDPYYRQVFANRGQAGIDAAGWMYDSANDPYDLSENLTFPCTPIRFLKSPEGKGKPCVLLATGCFAPVHGGHLEMMEKAKVVATQAGWDVLGGYLSPDHDEYVSTKHLGANYDIQTRIQILNNNLQNSWLRVDPWPGLFRTCAINFTDVMERLRMYLYCHFNTGITVILVVGGDNARFARAFEYSGNCIVVGRPTYNDDISDLVDGNRIIFTEGNHAGASSKIRLNQTFPKNTQKELLLRVENQNPLTRQIQEELAKHFSLVTTQTVQGQREEIRAFAEDAISLDPLVRTKYNLKISRNYDLFGLNMLGFTARPHSADLEKQIAKIPKGKYFLYDDDIHSGGTMKYVTQLLNQYGIGVIDTISFTKSLPYQEVLDCRDFIYCYPYSGLVVQTFKDGPPERCPYVYPLVDPYTRGSINNALEFSIRIWEINQAYWKGKDYHTYWQCGEYIRQLNAI